MRTAPDAPLGRCASWLEHDQQFVLAPARMRVTHARTPDKPGSPGLVGRCDVRAQRFPPEDPSLISRRRPRRACSGGAGIVTSSTPFLNVAFAWSAITPSGNGMAR